MNRYFATFPAGSYEIIARQLKSFRLNELKLDEHDDSSVIFHSSLSNNKLINLRYFTNIYLVIEETISIPSNVFLGKYYRLMLLKNGIPFPINSETRNELETQIHNEFKLIPNTHLAKNDFFLIERVSGKKLFTLKLSKPKYKRTDLSAGELQPELAHILCLAAGLKSKHRVVDMFAGYGSIPIEAVKGFGCNKVIAVDVQKLSKRHEHRLIEWREADARNLEFLDDNT